jgi:hypothetical protein
MKKKGIERDTDTASVRGFSTDQRISILSMNIDKKCLIHEKNESLLVGLSIEEAVLARQLESAEARATARCPKYKESNCWWKRVDELVEQHDELVKSICDKTKCLFQTTQDHEVEEEVSAFLNQKSPDKKRKFKDLVNNSEVGNLFDVKELVDIEDTVVVSLEVKEEKLKKVSFKNKRNTRSKK